MIAIACTACKKVMTIDDAFAGGVCRCTNCGTIQTVPVHLKGNADAGNARLSATGKSGIAAAPTVAPARRGRWAVIGLLVVVLAAAVGGGVWWWVVAGGGAW